MATITSSGIGSGLDIAGLVQQLVAAERAPTEFRIARLEARAQGQVSAFGSLKSALSSFNDQLEKMNTLTSLLSRKASVADETLLTISATESALPASYSVEVLQFAQAQKLQSGAFTDTSTVVGTGTLSIAVGADSFDITVDSTNNTLSNIRDAINNALDNTGVSASIITGDGGSYLMLSGENTGATNSIIVTQTGGDGGLSALEYDPPNSLNSLTQITAPLSASLTIDGLTVSSESNTIVDAIVGVTLDLLKADVGNPTVVKVENDKTAVVAQLDAFVNSYNALLDTFDKLTTFDAEAKTATALFGDSSIRTLRSQLRREMSVDVTTITATFKNLTDIGFDFEIDGKLTLDSTKLDTVLSTEFTKFGQLFANTDGFAVRLGTVVDSYLNADDGIIASRVGGLDITIADLAKRREALDRRMVSVEARLTRQFIGLDTLIGQLSSTSNFLTQQLNNLPGVNFVNR